MSKRGLSSVPRSELKSIKAEARKWATRLQARRKEIGLTQEELAEKLEISVTTIRSIETGIKFPSFPLLIRLAHTLKLDLLSPRK